MGIKIPGLETPREQLLFTIKYYMDGEMKHQFQSADHVQEYTNNLVKDVFDLLPVAEAMYQYNRIIDEAFPQYILMFR